ncbi:MAG: hypothetical protein WCP19_15280, partial [Chloroflexota bacterium]
IIPGKQRTHAAPADGLQFIRRENGTALRTLKMGQRTLWISHYKKYSTRASGTAENRSVRVSKFLYWKYHFRYSFI